MTSQAPALADVAGPRQSPGRAWGLAPHSPGWGRSPVEVLEGVGELQAGEEEDGLQALL